MDKVCREMRQNLMSLPFEIQEGQVVTVDKISGTPFTICKELLCSGVLAIADGRMPDMQCMQPDLVMPACANACGHQTKALLLTCQVRKDLQIRL